MQGPLETTVQDIKVTCRGDLDSQGATGVSRVQTWLRDVIGSAGPPIPSKLIRASNGNQRDFFNGTTLGRGANNGGPRDPYIHHQVLTQGHEIESMSFRSKWGLGAA